MSAFARAITAGVLLLLAWLLGRSRTSDETHRAPLIRFVVKHPWLTAGAAAGVTMAAAALLMISGIIPIKASAGHWTITAILLDFAKVRSVATHSWGITSPALDDDFLVVRGAGHYENGCVPCHGAPGRVVPPVMAAMTPTPPELRQRLSRWGPEELFSIVKHGIKFTGMPAWPAQQRDDEVWAMVAFLRRLPGLDASAYQQLVYGERGSAAGGSVPTVAGASDAPRAVRDVCWRCHGVNGTGRDSGAFPSLAGQRAVYLENSLRAFRDSTRFSGVMREIAAHLSDGLMREIALYYERLPARDTDATTVDASAVERGRTIATTGVPDRDIPACGECHGPTQVPKSPAYPKLSGQHVRYLTSQLALLQERRRGGSPHVNLMHVFVDRLRPGEIDDVARYYASLPGSLAPGPTR
jgi:cytochrome c553